MIRNAILILVLLSVGVFVAARAISSGGDASGDGTKVIVLGFDGMDPRLCTRLMDAGKLPNLSKMRDNGGFTPLATSIPPQSPVAWSSFITGANPGVHGIFDFIHRDPTKQYMPFYSAANTEVSEDGWEVGDYKIPLTFWPFNHKATETKLRRRGTPFWDYLDAEGIKTCFYDLPANYPPSPSKHGHMCCLSGMGTPDLLGTYGTYQYFSEDTRRPKTEGGGMRKPVRFVNHTATLKLVGPDNTYLKKPVRTAAEVKVIRHPTEKSVRLEFGETTIVVNEGEWSDWQQIEFELDGPPFLPTQTVSGICRFLVQEVHPNFRMYVTPLNIDPTDPGGQRITEPESFITDIADELGRFYTAGFQEDHKALSNGIFTDAEYHRQSRLVLGERLDLLGFANKNFTDGLLFFYFSSTDVQGHMFWWDSDDPHPIRSPSEARKYQQVMEDLYAEMDEVVGDMIERYGDQATILVMSDHGFCNFRRQFNVNTWLRDNGYIYPSNCKSLLDPRRGAMVDWTRTKAYGLGLNGLYLNLQGRERDGIVDPASKDALIEKITQQLLALRDPADGKPVIAKVYRTDEIYSGPHVAEAPDLIVGFHRGYRASWSTTLGNISDKVFSDNRSAWSADHCIAAELVPGVLFSNRPILLTDPSLEDLAPTILKEFGVTPPSTMKGRSVFESDATTSVDPS